MKRSLTPILLGTLVIAGVVPFILPLKNGKPLLDYRQIRAPSLPDIGVAEFGTNSVNQEPVTVYKWRGTDGEWQFGSNPPGNGIPVDVVRIELDQTVSSPPPDAGTGAPAGASDTVADVYSPTRIQHTIEQARQVQSMLNQRAKDQEAMARTE